MPRFVVCQPVQGETSTAPCQSEGGQSFTPMVVELASPGSVHFANAQQLFAYGFAAVLTCYLVGVAVGAILKQIRDA